MPLMATSRFFSRQSGPLAFYAGASIGMAIYGIGILSSAILIAMCVCAPVQSGPLDSDPTNDGAAAPDTNWETHGFAPSEATSGTADTGPALSRSGLTVSTSNGHGPGCTPLSPCATPSPALSGPLPVAKHAMRPRALLKRAELNLPAVALTPGIQNVAQAERGPGK